MLAAKARLSKLQHPNGHRAVESTISRFELASLLRAWAHAL